MDMPFAQAELYLSKITAPHFDTLNTNFENQNVLKRILIAMLNENMAVSNENFRICSEESVVPLYKCRLHLAYWGRVTTKISLVLVHFGLIKLKPKQNTSVFPTYTANETYPNLVFFTLKKIKG